MAPLFDTLLALLGMSSYLVSINNTTTNTTTNMTDIANVHNTATISLADPQVHLPTSLGLGLGLGLGPDHTRLDNLLSRRDFVWTDTNNQPQNLCGDSSFYTVDGGSGPARADCQEFISYAVSRDGYWLVTQFGNLGLDWQEFVVLESCKVAVRHADGAQGTIAIGNQDVIDLLNSIMGMFPDGDNLPEMDGDMSCAGPGTASAGVQWKIYGN